MKRLVVLVLLMMGMVLSAGNAVAAQDIETTTEADVEAIAELALDADPEALATELETAPADADLPEGFTAPASGTPENADIVDAFSTGLGEIEGAVANVTHGFDTDPAVVPGLISAGILTYIVVEDEITSDDLDDFAEGIESGLGDSEAAGYTEATVEEVSVNGGDAILVTLGMEASGMTAVVQMLAIPVGNTMVISTVLSVGEEAIDSADLTPITAELAVAGVAYLGSAAEAAA